METVAVDRNGLRYLDYSGDTAFDNAAGQSNAMAYQAGGINSAAPIPGSIEKAHYTVIRYRAEDKLTGGTCRSQLVSWPIPQRITVRWELELSFGGPDDEWPLTPPGKSPVLFWQVKTSAQGNPALAAIIDTDPNDPTKLCVYFTRRTGGMPAPSRIGQIGGLERGKLHQIVIDAYLDERIDGQGVFTASVNGIPVASFSGPTLVNKSDHHWYLALYMFNELSPSALQRAIYCKTARMLKI